MFVDGLAPICHQHICDKYHAVDLSLQIRTGPWWCIRNVFEIIISLRKSWGNPPNFIKVRIVAHDGIALSFNVMATNYALQWRHNERDGVSNHRRLHCLINHLLRHRLKKTSKLLVTGLCDRWIPLTRASNREKVSIWWRHPGTIFCEEDFQRHVPPQCQEMLL